MIQNYKTLVKSVNNIQLLLSKSQSTKLQKIYSSPEYIFIKIRLSGENLFLALGRGRSHEGLFRCEGFPEIQDRIIDEYLEFLRKYMINCHSIKIDSNYSDRAIEISMTSSTQGVLQWYFFWKGRKLYFSLKSAQGVFKPWLNQWDRSINSSSNSIEYIFEGLGLRNIVDKNYKEDENRLILSNDYLLSISKKRNSKTEKKISKKLERKLSNISHDYKKITAWKELQAKLLSDTLELEKDIVEFKGLKFKFKKNENVHHRRDKVFKKLKSLKLVEPMMLERLNRVREQIKQRQEVKIERNQFIFPVWPKSKKTKPKTEQIDRLIDLFEFKGLQIGRGKNSQGNDFIRNNWGKDGFWFHLHGDSSAHVCVKTKFKSDLSHEILSIVGMLLVEAKNKMLDEAELVYTEMKNVKGVKGVKGSVTLNKQKTIRVIIDQSLRKFLRSVQ